MRVIRSERAAASDAILRCERLVPRAERPVLALGDEPLTAIAAPPTVRSLVPAGNAVVPACSRVAAWREGVHGLGLATPPAHLHPVGCDQAEARIAEAQSSLQRIIETAPLAIALFDAHSQRNKSVSRRGEWTPTVLPSPVLPVEPATREEIEAEKRRLG